MRRSRTSYLMIVLAIAGTFCTTGFTSGPRTPATASASVPSAGIDPVDGIGMIYPTKPGGQVWHLSANPSGDPRLDGTPMTSNPDGTFTVRDIKTRIGISTTTYDQRTQEGSLTWRQPDLRFQGFMHDANDWRDVEITGYVRYVSGNDGDAFTWYARGGRHTGEGVAPEACWGTAYKGDLRFSDGGVKFEKEIYHDGGAGYAKGSYQGGGATIKGKMVGFKMVMYNIPGGVRLEAYLDRANNGTWTLVSTRDDTGGWSIDTANPCGGTRDEKVTWGGPKAAFRWDEATRVDLAKLSVREIAPGSEAACPAKLASAGVTASTWEDINPPSNATDGNLATRWSGSGSGAYLTLDMGASRAVCGVNVAWYQGDVRWNDYTVYTSTDNVTYTKAAEGRSSGTTLNPEPYRFAQRQARYVRIAWWNSSAGNGWASITEAAAFGAS
ncbi:discoidin domain-containing protein [Microtetraspora sp. AC03309]|uniref:discoidin domain-containing protein n=1 Tax=Microtetraspora sp. AC03309 TaxID=2779376 RepID=UPI001E414ABF|nr:discoidin domain-containing protein [Microtetraspora sp. AC03309]MCC5576278.1 discoidin domain-containing protein [Microtetraspora sp. AC03309]